MFRLEIFAREALFPNPSLPEQQQDVPIPPLGLIGVVDEYSSFAGVARWNDIGTWTLEIPAESPQAKWFVQGRGIVVFREGSPEPIFSGPITKVEKDWDASEGAPESLVRVEGVDDNVFLAERLTWTNPVQPINYASVNIHWPLDPTWENVGELIRALLVDNTHGHGDRYISKLYISREEIDLLDDETSKSTLLRFDQMDTQIRKMASVYGFRISCMWHPNPDLIGDAADAVPGQPGILVSIEPVEDLTEVVQYSPDFGNLKAYRYSVTAPKATRAVIGTQHRKWKEFTIKPTYDELGVINGYTEVEVEKTGPERYYTYLKNTSNDPEWWGDEDETPEDMKWTLPHATRGLTATEVEWGVTAERFLDESGIDWQWRQDPKQPTGYALDPPTWSKQYRQIQEAFEKFNVDNGPTSRIEIEPIDTPESKRVFEDYTLGDMVRAHIDDETWDEAVREIVLSASASEGHKANPVVGSDGAGSTPYLYRQVKRLWDEVREIHGTEELVLEDEEVPVPAFGFSRVVEEEV